MAAGALIDFVELTQVGGCHGWNARRIGDALLEIDAATWRSQSSPATTGGRPGSLLSDRPNGYRRGCTPTWHCLAAPLTDPDAIGQRLDQVQYLVEAPHPRVTSRDVPKAGRISNAHCRALASVGWARDLAAIRDGLRQGAALRALGAR